MLIALRLIHTCHTQFLNSNSILRIFLLGKHTQKLQSSYSIFVLRALSLSFAFNGVSFSVFPNLLFPSQLILSVESVRQPASYIEFYTYFKNMYVVLVIYRIWNSTWNRNWTCMNESAIQKSYIKWEEEEKTHFMAIFLNWVISHKTVFNLLQFLYKSMANVIQIDSNWINLCAYIRKKSERERDREKLRTLNKYKQTITTCQF